MPHLSRRLFAASLLLVAAALGACATVSEGAQGVRFVVVRHAEKADDGSKDPPLSTAGETRARALAASFEQAPLRAAYATRYRRTQATAAPAAQAHSLGVATYDANRSAADIAAQLRRDHHDGTVLVVAHSNTAPAIAAALCGCDVAPMDDAEFDRLLTVAIDAQGKASLREERY